MNSMGKQWDNFSRRVPEDGYTIEELNWVIGEDVMLKQDFEDAVEQFSKELFEAIKHGDKAHQDWLENKIKEFTLNRSSTGD